MAEITAELTVGTTVRITNGRHEWNADEPTDVGGDDTSPNPYELLLGALAACTCITVALHGPGGRRRPVTAIGKPPGHEPISRRQALTGSGG